MRTFIPRTFYPAGRGIQKVLGDLESHVLAVLWRCGACTVTEVRNDLKNSYKALSYNAVMTVLNRMVAKNLLEKKKRDGVFVYASLVKEKEFARGIFQTMLSSLLKDTSLCSAAHFLDIKDVLDEETKKQLKKLLE